MIKRVLTYFVLTLVVLQSAVAMSDTHQLHQSGTEHLVFDEVHQHYDSIAAEQQSELSVNSKSPTTQEWDCHHCCHCHGHFCPALLSSTVHMSRVKNSSPVPDYTAGELPDNYEPLQRPPKA